ncbi:DUF3899 domain-containing protein [Sporolactobacillus sp. THM7-4]|nr:DUF3899 domain-containing protein [Sporolactobacillus sp. THM7-4]
MRFWSTNIKGAFFLIFCSEGLLILLSQFFYQRPFSLLSLINAAAMISLIFFNAGLILFVFQGGFFDSMVYSFRRFSRALRNHQPGETDTEAPPEEYERRDGRRYPITWPLIFVSLLYFSASIILSLF